MATPIFSWLLFGLSFLSLWGHIFVDYNHVELHSFENSGVLLVPDFVPRGSIWSSNLIQPFELIPGPVRSPTPGPVMSDGPVRSPTPGPVRSPTPGPVMSPTPGPVMSPTPGPVMSEGPVRSPIPIELY